jgi:hypothetical protein
MIFALFWHFLKWIQSCYGARKNMKMSGKDIALGQKLASFSRQSTLRSLVFVLFVSLGMTECALLLFSRYLHAESENEKDSDTHRIELMAKSISRLVDDKRLVSHKVFVPSVSNFVFTTTRFAIRV